MLTFAGLYALMALGLNIVWGMAGMINLGLVGFFALGGYASALLTVNHFAAGLALHDGGSYTQDFECAIRATVTSSSHHGDIAASAGSDGRASARSPRSQTISVAPITSGAMKRFPGGVSTAL